MNYSNIFKRQTFMVVGAICVILIVLVGVSFALYMKNLKSKNLVVHSGDLEITFTEGSTIGGELTPMSDADGPTNGSKYEFTIKNDGTLNAGYTIQIYPDNAGDGTPIPHEYVKISYDGGAGVPLNALGQIVANEEESQRVYLVNSGNISTGSTNAETHSITLWISNTAPTSIIGNKVAFKIKVVSEVDKTN